MSTETWSRGWSRAAWEFWRTERPGRHFTTAAGPLVADRIADLLLAVDARLGHPGDFTVVDVGCGDGSLLELVRERSGALASRARWIGVDVRPFESNGISSTVAMAPCDLGLDGIRGVVMAHEWLDEIPCDVIERDADGTDRLLLVDRDGTETPGPPLVDDRACREYGVDAPPARAWIKRWWPLRDVGDRAEIGIGRDRAWRWMASLVKGGSILATDYGHDRAERLERYRHGTLTGYRAGRIVRPSLDGTANLTAHVAVDACAHALPGTRLRRQREEIAVPRLPANPSSADIEQYFRGVRLRNPSTGGEISWLRWDA